MRVFRSLTCCCLCACCLFVFHKARADQPASSSRFFQSGDDLSIELVTIGPGDAIQNYFGHNCMVVRDQRRRIAVLFNYGAFDFRREVAWEYIKGRLRFWVDASPVASSYRRYIATNRSIRVQELNLSAAQRLFVAEHLANNALPKNRYYLYHHFYDNCSTRLRDLIDSAINGELKKAYSDWSRFTLREHTRRFTQNHFFPDLMINFIMNDQVDKRITRYQEGFLPSELEKLVSKATYLTEKNRRVSLIKKSYTVFFSHRDPIADQPQPNWPYTLLMGLFLGALAVGLAIVSTKTKSDWPQRLFGIHHLLVGVVLGIPGSILFFMSNFTEHLVTSRNENLLLANPATAVILPMGFFIAFGYRWAYGWARYTFYLLALSSVMAFCFKLLPAFDQENFAHIGLILPINLGFALAHLFLAVTGEIGKKSRAPNGSKT